MPKGPKGRIVKLTSAVLINLNNYKLNYLFRLAIKIYCYDISSKYEFKIYKIIVEANEFNSICKKKLL